jgi:predicted nucleic acid-binding Zn ribbon protein
MSDDPVKECEICGEPVKRLLFPVAIHFKGNGFYSTDYARKNALASAGSPSGNGGSDSSPAAEDKTSGASGDGVKAASDKSGAAPVAAASTHD